MAGIINGGFALHRITSGRYVCHYYIRHRPSIVDAIFTEQCVQLGTDYLVAHYDVKSSEEPIYQTSGNVLTVHDNYVHLSVGEAGSCLSAL